DLGRPDNRRVDAIIDARAVSTVDVKREDGVHDVFVEPSSSGSRVRAPDEHRLFDFEVAGFVKWPGNIDDEEVRQQQAGQWMIAGFVTRPMDLPVEGIPEGEIGVQPRAVCTDIIRHEREGVLAVVEVSNL